MTGALNRAQLDKWEASLLTLFVISLLGLATAVSAVRLLMTDAAPPADVTSSSSSSDSAGAGAAGAGDAAAYCYVALADSVDRPKWVRVKFEVIKPFHIIADIAIAAAKIHRRLDFDEANAQLFLVKRSEEVPLGAEPTRADCNAAVSRPPINLTIRLLHAATRREQLPDWCWVVLRKNELHGTLVGESSSMLFLQRLSFSL